ncbi:hypothetical protein L3556_16050 [Candidatus Synechococcus calcipolaris G9]|uniref:Uncharacterized protein n=1 Tax=Candidatus Synechococcus calcipolaris G9 TaxID=1497997 RepID=A0ABT6F3M7_9SYNE|nr:hypothetical protein [Candidatus Synechococcus calcipolaris]MDG2992432.1 hypothetical protein [Candidatus Synechococcus calcipolaris G9]
MSLPEDFDPCAHLYSVFLSAHNRLVRDEFKDIDDDDLTVPRSSLRIACLVEREDSAPMLLLRLWLFYGIVRKMADMQAPIYGLPTDQYQEQQTFRPLVKLHFRQDPEAVPSDRSPVRADVSFRLRNETYQTITPAKLTQLANRIKVQFGGGEGWRWSRGKKLITYKQPENGFNFQIYALSQAEAVGLIQKICAVAEVPYDASLIVEHSSSQNYPELGPPAVILQESIRLPARRRTAFVRFRWASISIWGLTHDRVLVARATDRRNPIVEF